MKKKVKFKWLNNLGIDDLFSLRDSLKIVLGYIEMDNLIELQKAIAGKLDELKEKG